MSLQISKIFQKKQTALINCYAQVKDPDELQLDTLV